MWRMCLVGVRIQARLDAPTGDRICCLLARWTVPVAGSGRGFGRLRRSLILRICSCVSDWSIRV